MKKAAISIGDLNGIGFEISIAAHKRTLALCQPIYCVSRVMAQKACELLGRKLPDDYECVGKEGEFNIRAGEIDPVSAAASFESFVQAVDLCEDKEAHSVVTLPISKAAWKSAGIGYRGHTDYLKKRFGAGIMMLGCAKRFVALFTDHIPLSEVADAVRFEALRDFLLSFSPLAPEGTIGVLGLNPHNGDNGAIGSEDSAVAKAVAAANEGLNKERFEGPIAPDAAFTPPMIKRYRTVVALYHDQGLSPLKALFFHESINVTLGIPFARTSVDHGTAFDIAYKGKTPSVSSYLNAVSAAVNGTFHGSAKIL
ncbi:MAG: 4-hydroxythreonine-4-phosphate dehydrogenase [Helicobacteraceae bacterium]|jgi:4-hydroxythreonine-4-phosphate dehydrogenase|nr:4-hydroxythreonine-4-phosphate dehydrogenase [Helicobacteraceae bacterium]